MLTIKKRGLFSLAVVAAACLSLTACRPPAVRALHKGDRLVQDTKFEAAIPVLSQAVELLTNDPADVPVRAAAFNLLGLAYQGSSNALKAQQNYEQALALNRNLWAADFNLGCLELEHTNLTAVNLNAAKDFLTTYTSQQKWNVDGYLKLGTVHFRLGLLSAAAAEESRQFDNAKRAFESAQNLARTAEAGNDLGLIELLATPRPSAVAVSNAVLRFNVALAADPQYSPALLNLAIVYDKYLNDGHRALLIYGKYLDLNPPPANSKDVIALTNSLDRSMRMTIQMSNHAATPSSTVPETTPGAVTFIPSKPAHPPAAGPVETNSTRPPAGSAPMITPLPSPNTNPPPTPQYQQPPPSNTTPAPTQTTTLPASRETAVTTPPLTTPPTTAPPPKKSVLSKINPLNWFGGKASPTLANPGPAGNAPVVTPLPDPGTRSVAHYTPPAVVVNPGNHDEAERLRTAGIAAEKESRFRDAKANYQDAAKADPADYEACLALGLVAIKLEDFTTALDALHHAITLSPDSADARYAYAWALEKKNYFQDAANELEKLIAQKPGEIRAHLLLGNLYAQQLGQPDLARGHYQQVLDTDPQNPQAVALRSWLQSNPAR